MGFLSGVAKALNMADIHCKVMPAVSPYLKQPLIKLDQQVRSSYNLIVVLSKLFTFFVVSLLFSLLCSVTLGTGR